MRAVAVMVTAALLALYLYPRAQDIGSHAYDHYFPATPEVFPPQQEFFLAAFWLVLPAVLAALAVGVPAVRLRLAPLAVALWTIVTPAVAVQLRIPFSWDAWDFGLPGVYAISMFPVLVLAGLLSWHRHRVRCRRGL